MKFKTFASCGRCALIALLAGFIPGTVSMAVAQDAAQNSADIEPLILSEMKAKGVQGLSIAVIRNGEVEWSRGYGVTDFETGAPVGEDTTFQVASLGKMSAAYAVMMLVEKGSVTLDDPVSHPRLLIEEGCDAPIVRQALSHQTGMANDVFAKSFAADCAPGSRFSYSGQGFSALAALLAGRNGKAVNEVIDEMVFAPLGMGLTQYGDMLGASRAQGHVSALSLFVMRGVFGSPMWMALSGLGLLLITLFLPAIIAARKSGFGAGALMLVATWAALALILFGSSRIPAKKHIVMDADVVAAGLTSTAREMAVFGAELMRPTLVSAETRDLMFGQETNEEGCIQWALGIGIDNCAATTTYWHWGSNIGFESLFVLNPESGDGVVILTNTGGGLDTVVPGRGGFRAAKVIAREVMGIDGAWTLSGK